MKAALQITALNLIAALMIVCRTSGVDFRVYGSAIDGGTMQPLTNVEVELLYSPLSQAEGDEPLLASTNTDVNGQFDFGTLTGEIEGEARILQLPSSNSVVPLVEQVHLSSLNPTNQVIFRAGPAATLLGSIVITNGTAALTNFTVEVNGIEVDAAADGTFVISALPAYQQTARLIYQVGYYFDEQVISLPAMTPAGPTRCRFHGIYPCRTCRRAEPCGMPMATRWPAPASGFWA